MDLQLKGRTVLVTGSASGVGRATAVAFAEEGCSLVLWDISSGIEEAANSIGVKHGVNVSAAQVDLADFDATTQAFRSTIEKISAVDHVVHCAAVGSSKFGFPFTQLSPNDWMRVLEVNILGMVHVAHAVTPYFVERKKGSFVFLASVAGQIGSQTDPPYSASKAANINFSQCMAKDLAQYGIRVNTVCPGMVQTPLNRSVWEAWYAHAPLEDQVDYETWARNKIQSLVPLRRWQTPEDIASMIVFLTSDRAQQVTGQTINVDGGFVMHW